MSYVSCLPQFLGLKTVEAATSCKQLKKKKKFPHVLNSKTATWKPTTKQAAWLQRGDQLQTENTLNVTSVEPTQAQIRLLLSVVSRCHHWTLYSHDSQSQVSMSKWFIGFRWRLEDWSVQTIIGIGKIR